MCFSIKGTNLIEFSPGRLIRILSAASVISIHIYFHLVQFPAVNRSHNVPSFSTFSTYSNTAQL